MRILRKTVKDCSHKDLNFCVVRNRFGCMGTNVTVHN